MGNLRRVRRLRNARWRNPRSLCGDTPEPNQRPQSRILCPKPAPIIAPLHGTDIRRAARRCGAWNTDPLRGISIRRAVRQIRGAEYRSVVRNIDPWHSHADPWHSHADPWRSSIDPWRSQIRSWRSSPDSWHSRGDPSHSFADFWRSCPDFLDVAISTSALSEMRDRFASALQERIATAETKIGRMRRSRSGRPQKWRHPKDCSIPEPHL